MAWWRYETNGQRDARAANVVYRAALAVGSAFFLLDWLQTGDPAAAIPLLLCLVLAIVEFLQSRRRRHDSIPD